MNKWRLVGLITAVVWMAVAALPDRNIHVVFCDVGQGDAILISQGSDQLLVDGGPDPGKLMACLARHIPFYDRRLEAVVMTHNEKDHAGGLAEVRERYTVLQFEPKLEKGDKLMVGKIKFKVAWPDDRVLGATTNQPNEAAIVGKISYGGFDVMLTADVTDHNLPVEAGVEVVKVPHHGSKYSNTREWWEQEKPALAVISVGKNSFGHPAPEVLEILKSAGVAVARTDQGGDVEVVSDGEKWWRK